MLAPDGVGEVTEGTDLAALLLDALAASPHGPLRDGDVVLVTSKVVSKAEGRSRRGDRDTALAEELAAAGAPQPETIGLYGDDDGPFAEVGIPVAGAVTGDEDTKSRSQAQLWGGEPGRAYDGCYHSACDRIGNVDTVKLDRYTRAIAATLARFADATQRPSG